MRLPEGERSSTFWNHLRENIKYEIVSGRWNFYAAQQHIANGGNIILITNHFNGMDPGITLNLAQRIAPLENLAAYISTHHLSSWYRGPIMRSVANETGFTIYPTVQNKTRDKTAYEALFEAMRYGPPTKEAWEKAQKDFKSAQEINKKLRPEKGEKFPAVDEFNGTNFDRDIQRLAQGHGLITYILPEGTRSHDGQMQEGEKGAVLILRKVNRIEEEAGKELKTMVLPVAIEPDGKFQVFPYVTSSRIHIGSLLDYDDIARISDVTGLKPKDALLFPIAEQLPPEQRGYYSQFVK